jgi:L-lactate dehydrogenase (cytochrome)
LGELEPTATKTVAEVVGKTKDELRVEKAQREKPPLSRMLNLKDMEVSAITLDPLSFVNTCIRM